MSTYLEALELRRLLSAGSLDLTYGTGGIGADKLPAGTFVLHDKTVESGDRVLVAGTFTPQGGTTQNFLARYTAQGTRDTAFLGTATVAGNPRGLASIDLITTQPDGKILLLDRTTNAGLATVVRLTASGKVDTTFGKNGVTKVSFSTAREMIVGDDGRIIIVGDDSNNIQVARLTTAGILDSTFASGGTFTGKVNLAGTNTQNVTYTRLALFASETSDGKVLIAGSFDLHELNPASTFSHPFVARFTSTGQLDTTFDTDGTAEISDQGNVAIKGFAVLSSGKVIVSFNGTSTSSLERLNDDGSTDTAFGSSGIAAVSGASQGILAQSDGKILVTEPSALVRYSASGNLDSSFTDGNAPDADPLGGIGSDGSIFTVSVAHKQATDPFGYTIRPIRRWSEQAPAGLLAAADVSAAPSGPYKFSIQWRAEKSVAVNTLSSPSIQIVAPGGATYKATFLATTKAGNGSQRTANYKFSAPGGSWDAGDDGVYTVRLLGGVVKDTLGDAASARVLGQFNVQL
jgi:uncharacterized delta-60 repeat protein